MARILIAEDERDIRDLITFTLRFAGHDVIATSNGEEAWQIALQEVPDMILLDVRMPRMDGCEVCRKLKATSLTEHIPVVFLSAKTQESEVQSGLEAGAVEYILKPFSPDQLADRVRAILLDAAQNGRLQESLPLSYILRNGRSGSGFPESSLSASSLPTRGNSRLR